MLRAFRFIGFLFLLLALAVGVADYVRFTNGQGPMTRSAAEWANAIFPDLLSWLQTWVLQDLPPGFWDPGMLTILSLPAVAVLALKALFVFFIAGLFASRTA